MSGNADATHAGAPLTKGRVLHGGARYYDVLAGLLTLGREGGLRERLVELARISPGDVVLDVGCGTGTLALAAKRRVGATGTVHALDASPEMIAQARRKAAKLGADVVFHTAVVESLPFPDAHFDVVLSTLMLHHLPRVAREQCAREIRRVLKPAGRVLAVDFSTPARERRGLLSHLHRHGHVAPGDVIELLNGAGLSVVETGTVGVADLHFTIATAADGRTADVAPNAGVVTRSLPSLPVPRWIWVAVAVLVIAGHGVLLSVASSGLAISAVVVASIVGLIVVTHLGFGAAVSNRLRDRRRRG